MADTQAQKLTIQIVADTAQFDKQLRSLSARVAKLAGAMDPVAMARAQRDLAYARAEEKRQEKLAAVAISREQRLSRAEAAREARRTASLQHRIRLEETPLERALLKERALESNNKLGIATERAKEAAAKKGAAAYNAQAAASRLELVQAGGILALRKETALTEERITRARGAGRLDAPIVGPYSPLSKPSGGGEQPVVRTFQPDGTVLSSQLTKRGLMDIDNAIQKLRADSKRAGMEIYRNVGNPFLVVSSVVDRMFKLDKMMRSAEMARARVDALRAELRAAQAAGDAVAVDRLTKSLDSAIPRAKRLGDALSLKNLGPMLGAHFVATQMLTAGLFMVFQVATMIIEAFIAVGTEIVKDIVDPLGRARAMAKDLKSAIDALGGAKKLSIALELSPDDRAILERLEELERQRPYAEALLAAEKYKTQRGVELTPETEARRVAELVARERILQQAGIGGFVAEKAAEFLPAVGIQTLALSAGFADILRNPARLFQKGGLDFLGAGKPVDEAAITRQISSAAQRADLTGAMDAIREMTDLTEAQRKAVEAVGTAEQRRLLTIYDSIQAEKSRTAELSRQRDELERERYRLTGNASGLGTGEGAATDKWFMREVAASRKIEQLQRALGRFSDQVARRQQNQQLGQARADVIRAGIGRPGQTGFELAAALLEARERAREAREQIQVQRRQEVIQRKIEYWNSVQANAKRQQDIMANAVAMGLNNAQLALTVDPKSGQLLARFVAGDVYNMLAGAAANNTPVTGGGGRGTGRIPTP